MILDIDSGYKLQASICSSESLPWILALQNLAFHISEFMNIFLRKFSKKVRST